MSWEKKILYSVGCASLYFTSVVMLIYVYLYEMNYSAIYMGQLSEQTLLYHYDCNYQILPKNYEAFLSSKSAKIWFKYTKLLYLNTIF